MPSEACGSQRPGGRPHVRLLASVVLLLGVPSNAQLQAPDSELPILSRLGGADALAAVAISPDGDVAVAAEAQKEGDRRTVLRVVSIDGGELARFDLRGNVRGIVFAPAGDRAFVVAHRPAKKGDGEAQLYTLSLTEAELRRARSLPPTSAGLDVWSEQRALVVASRDEIRTFLLPDLRSGPLYRIPGVNLSVTSIAGSSRILIGQPTRLLLVDLTDPPGEDAMPIRDQVDLGAPAVAIASARNGSRALVRLDDGRLLEAAFDPLSLRDAGTVTALASRPALETSPPIAEPQVTERIEPPAEEPEPRSEPLPPANVAEPQQAPVSAAPGADTTQPSDAGGLAAAAATTAAATDEPPREPASAPEEAAASAGDPQSQVADEPAASTTDQTAGTGQTAEAQTAAAGEPAAGTSEEVAVAVASGDPQPKADEPAAAAADREEGHDAGVGRVTGSISGPRPPHDLFVVLFGPNNMVREAARVPVDREGRWEIEGLAPGRYRVQLDAGGSTVLVTDPQFRVLDLKEGEAPGSLDFRVVREL